MDAEAILYHGRTGGIFSAPMNVYNPSNGNYEPQSPSSIQPATAVDFFNDYGYTRTQTTDFTNAVIDPDAPNPYGIAPTNGMYYNGLRNEVN
jgi:hypothetical protein